MTRDTHTITFDDEHADRIRTGEKTATIRHGFDVPLEPGESVRLVDEQGDEILRATVDEVFARTVAEIVREGIRGHRDYRSVAAFDTAMAQYYPDVTFTATTAVTVVTWTAETTTEKGERNEREAANILGRVYGSSGVEKVDAYSNTDPFGIVDVLAIDAGKKVLFVQVKTNRFTDQDRRKYAGRMRKVPFKHAQFEVWVRVDREGWRLHRYDPERETFDEYLSMDTCDHEQTVEAYREAVGYYEDGGSE